MNGGTIINVAPAVAVRVRTNIAAYASSKGAVVVLTKEIALELAPYKREYHWMWMVGVACNQKETFSC